MSETTDTPDTRPARGIPPRFGILSQTTTNEINQEFDGCRLCWAISPSAQRFPANCILHVTDDYVVIPTLGTLVPGYILFVSKAHTHSVARLDPSAVVVLERQLNTFLSLLSKAFPTSPWVVFEHGNTLDRGVKACCVDHLHLHILPFGADLAHELAERLSCPYQSFDSLGELAAHVGAEHCNYLLTRDVNGLYYVIKLHAYSSQYVRQVIAVHAGRGPMWNWMSHPYEDGSRCTVRTFQSRGLTPRVVYYAHAIEGVAPAEVCRDVENARRVVSAECPHVRLISMFELLQKGQAQGFHIPEKELSCYIVETEVRFLEACDVLLVDLSRPNWQYVGALMEVVYASRAGIPVIVVVGDSEIQGRRWLRAHAMHVVPTLESAARLVGTLCPEVKGPWLRDGISSTI